MKSHPDYTFQQPTERLDEKLLQFAAIILLKISSAAETFIPNDTKQQG